MPKVEYSEGSPQWEIECELEGLPYSEHFHEFIKRLKVLNSAVPLDSFVVEKTAPGQYTYSFTTKDNRTWTQTFRFNGGEIKQTFDVPAPGFVESEFVLHRDVRNHMMSMVPEYRLIKIEVHWT